MSCSSCKHLIEGKKCDGSVSGACYYCCKANNYVNGSDNKCEKYELSYGRSNYTCDKIYNEGIEYHNDNKPVSFYMIILIIFIIIAIIFNV